MISTQNTPDLKPIPLLLQNLRKNAEAEMLRLEAVVERVERAPFDTSPVTFVPFHGLSGGDAEFSRGKVLQSSTPLGYCLVGSGPWILQKDMVDNLVEGDLFLKPIVHDLIGGGRDIYLARKNADFVLGVGVRRKGSTIGIYPERNVFSSLDEVIAPQLGIALPIEERRPLIVAILKGIRGCYAHGCDLFHTDLQARSSQVISYPFIQDLESQIVQAIPNAVKAKAHSEGVAGDALASTLWREAVERVFKPLLRAEKTVDARFTDGTKVDCSVWRFNPERDLFQLIEDPRIEARWNATEHRYLSPLMHAMTLARRASSSAPKVWSYGSALVKQGTSVGLDQVYTVLRGKVSVSLEDGREVGTFGKGYLFGELSVFYGIPRTATVKVDSVGAEIATLSADDLETTLRRNPLLARVVFLEAEVRLRELITAGSLKELPPLAPRFSQVRTDIEKFGARAS